MAVFLNVLILISMRRMGLFLDDESSSLVPVFVIVVVVVVVSPFHFWNRKITLMSVLNAPKVKSWFNPVQVGSNLSKLD